MKVFVYGTLKPGEINFEGFFDPLEILSTPAMAQGQLYQIPFYTEKYSRGYPAMTLGKDWVAGYLFEIESSDLLERLDNLEGYKEGRSPKENDYQRQCLPVFTLEKEFLTDAWVYVMTQEQLVRAGGFQLNRSSW